ncbi:MAG: FAD-dependent oxidoreductase [Bacilli bacterium]
MKLVVIGAVAAGTSAAAKARRNDDAAEIIIFEKDGDISYSGCGLPYYIGGHVENLDELTPRDAAFFKKKYNVDVQTGYEVLTIDSEKQIVSVRNVSTDEQFEESYDKLIIATGAAPFIPPIDGVNSEHVFFLRNVQSARRIAAFIEEKKPQSAVIAGTGFIGFEMLENLIDRGINVTIIERDTKITPVLDIDMATYLENQLKKNNVKIIKQVEIKHISNNEVVLNNGESVPADFVLLATGVRPNVTLAKHAGVQTGITGAIAVNEKMETNVENIFACGDCIETYSLITKKPVYRPLGSTANKTGRIAGDVATGGNLRYRGNLGTGIFKIFGLTVANTGLSEAEARREGYDIEICHNIKPDKPHYFNGKEMVIKAIADRATHKILGVQIVGAEGVDKRIDVFATLITYGATVDELFHLDLAYAPPFATTKDPVHYTGMILDNAMNNGRPLITAEQLRSAISEGADVQLVDARATKQFDQKHVPTAQNIPHGKLRENSEKLDALAFTVTYCNKGVTGNAAQNILLGRGIEKVYNLSGGNKFFQATKQE